MFYSNYTHTHTHTLSLPSASFLQVPFPKSFRAGPKQQSLAGSIPQRHFAALGRRLVPLLGPHSVTRPHIFAFPSRALFLIFFYIVNNCPNLPNECTQILMMFI